VPTLQITQPLYILLAKSKLVAGRQVAHEFNTRGFPVDPLVQSDLSMHRKRRDPISKKAAKLPICYTCSLIGAPILPTLASDGSAGPPQIMFAASVFYLPLIAVVHRRLLQAKTKKARRRKSYGVTIRRISRNASPQRPPARSRRRSSGYCRCQRLCRRTDWLRAASPVTRSCCPYDLPSRETVGRVPAWRWI
jgi:hypothetical protein